MGLAELEKKEKGQGNFLKKIVAKNLSNLIKALIYKSKNPNKSQVEKHKETFTYSHQALDDKKTKQNK